MLFKVRPAAHAGVTLATLTPTLSFAVTKSAPLPTIASLYPVLSFLVGGNGDDDQGGDDGGDGAAASKKKDKKRPLPPSEGDVVPRPVSRPPRSVILG